MQQKGFCDHLCTQSLFVCRPSAAWWQIITLLLTMDVLIKLRPARRPHQHTVIWSLQCMRVSARVMICCHNDVPAQTKPPVWELNSTHKKGSCSVRDPQNSSEFSRARILLSGTAAALCAGFQGVFQKWQTFSIIQWLGLEDYQAIVEIKSSTIVHGQSLVWRSWQSIWDFVSNKTGTFISGATHILIIEHVDFFFLQFTLKAIFFLKVP